jgi:hypothetical protein
MDVDGEPTLMATGGAAGDGPDAGRRPTLTLTSVARHRRLLRRAILAVRSATSGILRRTACPPASADTVLVPASR